MYLFLSLNLEPIPCPRPRLSHWGVHYPAVYSRWKKRAAREVRSAVAGTPGHHLLAIPLRVWLLFVVKKPKNTKLRGPKPDIDNYMKSILDACTGIVWTDDSLIQSVTASKTWSGSVNPGIYMVVQDEPRHEHPIPTPRTVPQVRKQRRDGEV